MESEEKTIEIVKGGKPRKVRVKIFEIDWEGKKEEVIIKKLSAGERWDLIDRYMHMDMVEEVSRGSMSAKDMHLNAMLMGLHKAPFPVTEDYISYELDGEIGDILYKKIEEFNGFTKKQKKN